MSTSTNHGTNTLPEITPPTGDLPTDPKEIHPTSGDGAQMSASAGVIETVGIIIANPLHEGARIATTIENPVVNPRGGIVPPVLRTRLPLE